MYNSSHNARFETVYFIAYFDNENFTDTNSVSTAHFDMYRFPYTTLQLIACLCMFITAANTVRNVRLKATRPKSACNEPQ